MTKNFRQDEDGQEFLQGLIEPDKDVLPEDVSLVSYGENNEGVIKFKKGKKIERLD